jgi:hypothetical protein
LPENATGPPNLTRGALQTHKWPKPHSQAVHRSVAVGPAKRRCRVERPIGVLDQRRRGVGSVRATGLRAKPVKSRQRTTWGDLEDRPIVVGPPIVRCALEVTIGGLDQRPPVGAAADAVVEDCKQWTDDSYAISLGQVRIVTRPKPAFNGMLSVPWKTSLTTELADALSRARVLEGQEKDGVYQEFELLALRNKINVWLKSEGLAQFALTPAPR